MPLFKVRRAFEHLSLYTLLARRAETCTSADRRCKTNLLCVHQVFGPVTEIKVIRDKVSNESRGTLALLTLQNLVFVMNVVELAAAPASAPRTAV
jgi:hypothetical protein